MNVDVVFTLTGDIRWNSRALKQLRLLNTIGCSVLAIGIADKSTGVQQGDGVVIRTLKRPGGSGPRFFKQVHELMKETVLDVESSIYHASDLYTLPAQAAAAKRHRGKLVYDARELYPNVASTTGRPWAHWFWRTLEWRFSRKADLVSTVSPSIADQLVSRYRIKSPVVLYNVPEFEEVPPSSVIRNALGIGPDTCIILHQGNVQKDRGCFVLAEAMKQVDHAVLVFLGGGPLKEQLKDYVNKEGLGDRVRFLAKVDPSMLLAYTASADVGVTLLEDTCLNHRFALPNKLFEYFMAGVPVLASDLPEIRRVVNAFDAGVLVDPAHVDHVAQGLQKMVKKPELREALARNTSAVLKTYSWEQASQEFVIRYKDLLSHSTR